MLIGYARTSTVDQVAGYEAQVVALEKAGAEKLFKEQVSAVARHRPELEAALDFIREGDTLVVVKLDRLARSVAHLVEIVGKLLQGGFLVLQQFAAVSSRGGRDPGQSEIRPLSTFSVIS